MIISGKCKEDFETWYKSKKYKLSHYREEYSGDGLCFLDLNLSMQFGVFVDFFDTVGIPININRYSERNDWQWDITTKPNIIDANSRPEARKASLEKANEIYNAKKNKHEVNRSKQNIRTL